MATGNPPAVPPSDGDNEPLEESGGEGSSLGGLLLQRE